MLILQPATTPRQVPPAEQRCNDPDRDVNEHHRPPAEECRKGSPSDGACGEPAGEDGDQVSERLVPFGPFRKNPNENGKGGDRRHGRPYALDRPRNDQGQEGLSDPASERRNREQDQPGDEDLLLPVHVPRPPHQQKETGDGDRVGPVDPLAVGDGSCELDSNGRERDRDYRRVDYVHEVGSDDNQEDQANVRNGSESTLCRLAQFLTAYPRKTVLVD